MTFPLDTSLSSLSTSSAEREEEPIPFNIRSGILEGLSGSYYTLTIVDLIYQGITDLTEGCFNNVPGLIELNLQGNSLKRISGTIFNKLINLQRLYLGANDLTSVSKKAFHGLPLRELSLNTNQLSYLSRKIFHGQHQLQLLFLNENKIRMLRALHFEHVISLKELYLHENPLEHIDETSFDLLINIRKINLCIHKRIALPKERFSHLTYLEEFKVHDDEFNEVNLVKN